MSCRLLSDCFVAHLTPALPNGCSNRAPLGLFIHAAWLMDPTRNAEMNQFIDYALSHENVWFVTINDVSRPRSGPFRYCTLAGAAALPAPAAHRSATLCNAWQGCAALAHAHTHTHTHTV